MRIHVCNNWRLQELPLVERKAMVRGHPLVAGHPLNMAAFNGKRQWHRNIFFKIPAFVAERDIILISLTWPMEAVLPQGKLANRR